MVTSLSEIREQEREQDFECALREELIGKIRAFRIFKEVSIEGLSEKSRVSVEYIQEIEDGNGEANFSTLYALANALNLKINLKITDLDS